MASRQGTFSLAFLLIGLSILAGRVLFAQAAARTQPEVRPTSAPASAPATAPTSEPATSAPATTAPSTTAPTTAPATAPTTAPAPPAPPVLHLHVGAVADESIGTPKPQLSGPPPQIIRLTFPPQIAALWAGALPQDTDVMLKNVSFDLHPTADGVFRIDQGIWG